MRSSLKYLLALPLLGLLLQMQGCGTCGFDCSDGNDNEAAASLTLSFSDAPLEDLKEVVIEVSAIEFRRDNLDPIVVETFDLATSSGRESFKIDLLQFPGIQSQEILTGLTVPADFYDEIFIEILSGDVNHSYVLDDEDMSRVINVDDSGLLLSGRQVDAENQDITVEFGLARALKFNANDDTYTLDEEGVRVVQDSLDPSLGGIVDEDLFTAAVECDDMEDGDNAWNRVYLYEGTGLDLDSLGDVFTEGAAGSAGKIAPYAASTLTLGPNGWQFSFGYLPSGGYTLAFSCNAQEDDARTVQDITIPLPADQVVQLSLSTQENVSCDLELQESPRC
ncbi:MAG: DUF4382 domain-containing protein [Halioglobus sp.]|nr:DUF4382 domain-containing protein [Halioglobus sp.]